MAAAAIVIGTFLAMEGVAWWTHRYVMHGWLWVLHRSHHRPRRGAFELNDLFAVFFAVPAVALVAAGVSGYPALLWVGVGVTLYGVFYALFHDVLVHRRARHRYSPRRGYLARIHQAHHIHHAVRTKHGAVSFGFLFAPDPARLRAKLSGRG